MDARPRTLTVVVVFLVAATAISFFVGAALLFPNPAVDWLWDLTKPAEATFRRIGRLSGVPLLLLGIATFAAAKGLLIGKRWAWWFAVLLFVVNGIGDVVSFIVTGDWLRSASGVVISSTFVWALMTKTAQKVCWTFAFSTLIDISACNIRRCKALPIR